MDKGPEQNADGIALSEQLNETGSSKQPKKTQVDEVVLGRWRKNTQARSELRAETKDPGTG